MFKIGQKVVCKDDKNPTSKYGGPRGIIKGDVYEVCGVDKCEFCGLELILLKGIDSGSRKECICSSNPILPTNAFASYRFEPLTHDSASNREILKDVVVKESLITKSEPVFLN